MFDKLFIAVHAGRQHQELGRHPTYDDMILDIFLDWGQSVLDGGDWIYEEGEIDEWFVMEVIISTIYKAMGYDD